ncbi:MAG: hypothetical protein Q4D55_11835 [Eubacteriales bacterium]|nr:hypothetical protein [Eubacteriales bacterium]
MRDLRFADPSLHTKIRGSVIGRSFIKERPGGLEHRSGQMGYLFRHWMFLKGKGRGLGGAELEIPYAFFMKILLFFR